jgi:hypothetical protein
MSFQRNNQGYSLLEILLSTGIFMTCITLVLLAVSVFSGRISSNMSRGIDEVSRIRFLHCISGDISHSGIYEADQGAVTFGMDGGVPVFTCNGMIFDSDSKKLLETEIEYRFTETEVIRSESLAGVDSRRMQEFKISNDLWESFCLGINYKEGNPSFLSVGDIGDFHWGMDVDYIVIQLGHHMRTLRRDEFGD